MQEVILTFGGFMTTYAKLNVWLVKIYATIGADIGAIILYLVGRMVSTDYLNRLISGKIGRVLRLSNTQPNIYTCWNRVDESDCIHIVYYFRNVYLEYCTSMVRLYSIAFSKREVKLQKLINDENEIL